MSRLLKQYQKWEDKGRIGTSGLCNALHGQNYKLLQLFEPSFEETALLKSKNLANVYWGSGLKQTDDNRFDKFTPLRKTIVLLIAAMKGEL